MFRRVVISGVLALSASAQAADYPPNIDYGSRGDFITKAGTEYGRTADLMPIGPALVNIPEGPGSTELNVDLRMHTTVWDLSDLRNPQLIREENNSGQPIQAHGTVVRFDDAKGPLLYSRSGLVGDYYGFDPSGATSAQQIYEESLDEWRGEPLNYTNMFSPFYIRTYWDYGFDPSGTFAIRDLSQMLPSNGLAEYAYLGDNENYQWLGTPVVTWDHLGLTSVTGFTAWLGNLLVVASDQQATGMAIYDVSGFEQGQQPRLLSVLQPTLTSPSGDREGMGGYWMEPYGTHKMVWAARERGELTPTRSHPAMFVADFTDPTRPFVSCAIYFDQDENDPADGDDSSDPMYVNFQDEYAFVDHFRVDIPACEAAYRDDRQISAAEFRDIVYRFDDIDNGCDGSQYFRPLGQVGVFGGYDYWPTTDVNEQGMCLFVTSDTPDTRPPFVSGHRPLNGQTDYPVDGFIHVHIPETLRTESVQDAVRVTHVDTGAEVSFRMQLSHTGTLSLWPDSHFDAGSTYRVELRGIQDYMGNTMEPYTFVFSTGSTLSVQAPDNEVSAPVAPPAVPDAPDADPSIEAPGGEPDPESEGELPAPVEELEGPVGLGPAPTAAGPYFAPVQSSEVACDAESLDGEVWTVNPDNDSIAVVEVRTDEATQDVSLRLAREIKLGYEHPTSIARIEDGYVATYQDSDRVVFFAREGSPRAAIHTGYGSQPVSVVTEGNYAYVALYGSGEVARLSWDGLRITHRVEVGPTPKAMALHDDRLLVTRFISGPEHAEVYEVNIRNAATRVMRVNKVEVPDDIVHGSGVPNYLSSIVVSPDGARAYVTATKANTDRGLVRNGLPLDDDNTVRPMMVVLDLERDRDANVDPTTREGTIDFDNGSDPSGVTFLVDGVTRVHSLRGNDVVVAQNLESNQSAQFAVGHAPTGMCSNGRTLFVKNFTDRTLSAVEVAGFMADGRLGQRVEEVATVRDERLSEEELLGKQIFYSASRPDMGPEGYISCASCHADGGQDGRVWDMTAMGEGLRNTLSLNGTGGTRFGNLHWSSNFDEVQDFEIQIEQLNGGHGLIGGAPPTFEQGQTPLDVTTSGRDERLDALAAYVSSLGKDTVSRSPYRLWNGEMSEFAKEGRQVFEQQGCTSCHAGPAFRDGRRHDVGTLSEMSGQRLGESLDGIRTPTLVDLWQSAPYFHDGSAATLEEVLDTGTHRVEGWRDRVVLVNYLLSLDRQDYIDDDAEFTPAGE